MFLSKNRLKGFIAPYRKNFGVISEDNGEKYNFLVSSEFNHSRPPDVGTAVTFLVKDHGAGQILAYNIQPLSVVPAEDTSKPKNQNKNSLTKKEPSMFTEDFLKLKQLFAPDVLWRALPNRLLGKVQSKMNSNTGYITPAMKISYPNGALMDRIFSYELSQFREGEYVFFSMRDSKESEKTKWGQKDLQQAINIERATPEDINALENDSNFAGLILLSQRLKKLADEFETGLSNLETEKANLEIEIETRVKTAVSRKTDELTEWEIALRQRAKELENREQDINVTVAEKVAARNLELDAYQTQLDERAKDIQRDKEKNKRFQEEVNVQKQEFLKAQAKFREEGGEEFITYMRSLQAPDGLRQELTPLADKQIPKNFHAELHAKLAEDNFRVQPPISVQFLLSALTAARTGQFVVLSGPTGVGKTSMVHAFAAALGAGYGVVAVRPSWIDPTDLLGFYNPQTHRYQASPFMDCFLDAKRYSEANRLYFLTLDELNLARVENYAADFLSRLEKAHTGEGNACISLYSRDIEQLPATETSQPDLKSLADAALHRSKYPSSLGIPDGLVMFGTINLDDTTYHLSPKFLDRSFVINIPTQELLPRIIDLNDIISQMKAFVDLSLNNVKELSRKHDKPAPEVQKIWEDILHWQENYIRPLGINLGFRFSQTYLSYMNIALRLDLSPWAAASTFFKSKLFPWISFHRDDPSIGDPDQTKLNVLESWVEDDSLNAYPDNFGLRDALEGILERSASSVVIRYLE